MADPSRQHAQAVYDLLRAALPGNVDIYVAEVDKDDADLTWPYVVLWPPPARRLVGSVEGTDDWVDTRMQITGAGTTKDEVLAVLDRSTAALHGVTPVIAGRECGQIRMPEDLTVPIRKDPTARTPDGRDVYMGIVFVNLSSVAAA